MTLQNDKDGLHVRNISKDLKRQFKAHCAIKGVDMNYRVAQLMEMDINDRIPVIVPPEPLIPTTHIRPMTNEDVRELAR